MGVPVGRKNLFSEPRRAVLGVGGVAVALLLVLMLGGIVDGAIREVTAYIDTSPADVFVAQAGVRNMHMASSTIPIVDLQTIRGLPGVSWADPILYAPDAVSTASGRRIAYVIGFVSGGRGGPAALVEGRAPGSGEVVIDQRAAESLGAGVGDEVVLLGERWSISGLTSGLTNLANTVAFVTYRDFEDAIGTHGTASYVLVGGDAPAADLAATIERTTSLSALSKSEFADQERRLVEDMSAQLIQIMNVAALLIALAVIALTLFSTTLSHLREVGVIKALGATRSRLTGVVLSQAAWTVLTAVAVAVALAVGLAVLVSKVTTNVSILLEPAAVARLVVAATALGLVGAITPMIKVWRVDPATVFRRNR